MKLYIHKHIVFDINTWETIENYMKEHNLENFTELVKNTLFEKIGLAA